MSISNHAIINKESNYRNHFSIEEIILKDLSEVTILQWDSSKKNAISIISKTYYLINGNEMIATRLSEKYQNKANVEKKLEKDDFTIN